MDVKDAQKLHEQARTYWASIYEDARKDLLFSIGEGQWNKDDEAARKLAGRPCLVVNQLPQFIHQVTNDMRQNTPSINVLPVGEGSDLETAKIFKGLIRNIEYESGADEVYDTAGEYSVKCSIGFIRVDHAYEDEDSFKQKLFIKRVQNPLVTYLDPNSIECDGSDAEWAISEETVSKGVFEATYPGKKFISFDSKDTQESKEESIVIAEIFKKTYKTVSKQQGADGTIADYVDDGSEAPAKSKRRTIRKCIIKRYKFSGDELLEETTFPGKYIPIIPVYGEETWVDGERKLGSLIRQSKDAQRRYNYWASKEMEFLAMASTAPFMAAVGQTEDFAKDWQNPGSTPLLRYVADVDGKLLPAPQRLAPPPVPIGIVNAMTEAREDIKATMGLYNNNLGQKGNETSGIAINSRKQQGETATFHFGDNRNRSIAHCGRVLVNAIPEIYDTAQIIRTINEEDSPEMVGINGQIEQGQEQHFNLTTGKYDVRVTTGPSFTTKRQESSAFMSDMVKAAPQLMGIAGDLLVKNMDIAGADALAARLRKTIPKELTAEEDAKAQGQQAPTPQEMQLQQQIQQMDQQMQAMDAHIKETQPIVDGKMMEMQVKEKELALKEQEMAQKHQIDLARLALDEEKIQLEYHKTNVAQLPPAKPEPDENDMQEAANVQAIMQTLNMFADNMHNISTKLDQLSQGGFAPPADQLATQPASQIDAAY